MDETRISLLQRVKNPTDRESWEEFFSLYAPLLANFVRKKGIRNASDVDDVVQELLINLARRLPEFDLDKQVGRFRTYLWQAAHNAVVSWIRKTARHQHAKPLDQESVILQLEEESRLEPSAEFLQEARARTLELALSKVKSSTQDSTWLCFESHILKRVPAQQVAKKLNRTENSVYVNANRVLKRVREVCLEYGENLDDSKSVG